MIHHSSPDGRLSTHIVRVTTIFPIPLWRADMFLVEEFAHYFVTGGDMRPAFIVAPPIWNSYVFFHKELAAPFVARGDMGSALVLAPPVLGAYVFSLEEFAFQLVTGSDMRFPPLLNWGRRVFA